MGISISAQRLVSGLSQRGYRIAVLARDKLARVVGSDEYRSERTVGATIVNYLSERVFDNDNHLVLDWYERYVAEFKPDVVHVYGIYVTAFWGLAASRMAKVPLVLSCRGDDVTSSSLVELPTVRSMLESADAVTAVSTSILSWARHLAELKYSAPVFNAIDADAFHNTGPRTRDAGHLNIGTLAEFRWKKGPDYLIALLAHLDKLLRGPLTFTLIGTQSPEMVDRVRAVFAGDHPYPREVISNARPPRSEIPDQLAVLDMLLITSVREGMPNVMLESMACGTPVAATAIDGCVDVLDGTNAGLLLDPHDPHSAAIAIRNALEDPIKMDRMSKSAYNLLRDRFNVDSELNAVENIYRRLSAVDGEAV
jgi:glycosyltransferase involved in cell wall biosynthesis